MFEDIPVDEEEGGEEEEEVGGGRQRAVTPSVLPFGGLRIERESEEEVDERREQLVGLMRAVGGKK